MTMARIKTITLSAAITAAVLLTALTAVRAVQFAFGPSIALNGMPCREAGRAALVVARDATLLVCEEPGVWNSRK